jgi:hypothetical protein
MAGLGLLLLGLAILAAFWKVEKPRVVIALLLLGLL